MSSSSALLPADVEVVLQAPLFAGLSPQSAADLLSGASVRTFGEETLLFSVGDPADSFFVVIEGAVKLFVLNEDGTESVIEIVGAGTSFAEAAIFASRRFPVNAEAMAETRLVRFDAASFLRNLEKDKGAALKMLAAMGRWQLRLMAELWELKAQTPAQRLAWYLVKLTDAGQGPATVKLPFAKNLIASRIGIAPESLSRALTRLTEVGVVVHGDAVTIRDVEGLRRFSGM